MTSDRWYCRVVPLLPSALVATATVLVLSVPTVVSAELEATTAVVLTVAIDPKRSEAHCSRLHQESVPILAASFANK